MLNLALGTSSIEEGRSTILTGRGSAGHAVYGPYELLEPGRYVVEFNLELADAGPSSGRDLKCAVLDVVANLGRQPIARKEVFVSSLLHGRTRFKLRFELTESSNVEYRVWVSGKASLLIDEYRRVSRVPVDESEAVVAGGEFPGAEADAIPFFAENRAFFRSLYDQQWGVSIVDGAVVLTVNGVSLHADSRDDIAFIGEIFVDGAYNFLLGAESCVIDIGMNVGLASLSFAARSEVREVHGFEPFASTFERAADNLALNPSLAAKITAYRAGLADRDWSGDIRVATTPHSGSRTTLGAAEGDPVFIELRDAGRTLAPIIERARAQGRRIVMKVDCEGSEFAVFESLDRAGLFGAIDAIMIEWHRIFPTKGRHDLFAPLQRNGFVIFDRSPPVGNGFFYAARVAA